MIVMREDLVELHRLSGTPDEAEILQHIYFEKPLTSTA